jgi:hypothetical protein
MSMVFGLDRFELHRHLVDWTEKSVWFRQVFGLHRFKLHKYLVDETRQTFQSNLLKVYVI